MKLKSRPEDFVVEELWRFELARTGPVGLYELAKKGVGTIEAVRHAAGLAGVSMTEVFFGGLKDRHAWTRQYVSIRNGPPRDFQGSGYDLRHLGRLDRHLNRADFLGNRFVVTIRDLTGDQAAAVAERARAVERDGVPNYFDEQRFGSLRGSGEFAARSLIRGNCEEALRLVLASPSAEDRSGVRRVKVLMRNLWGRWQELENALPARARERQIVRFLAKNPGRFADAFEMLEKNLRTLIIHAYQSFLFNEILARWVETISGGDLLRVDYRAGTFYFWRALEKNAREAAQSLSIPLVSDRMEAANGEIEAIVSQIMEREGVRAKDFKLDGLRRTRFSRGTRPAAVLAKTFSVENPFPDELNKNKRAVRVAFELPPGSYATIFLKRLTYDMMSSPKKGKGGKK